MNDDKKELSEFDEEQKKENFSSTYDSSNITG